jgi:hypothetical protein
MPAGEAEMDAAMQKLLTCGYFDRVAYRYDPSGDGYALTWQVQEVSVFYPVKFFDLPVKEEEAKKILLDFDPLFGPKIPATQEVLRRYATVINQKLGLKVEGEELRRKGPCRRCIWWISRGTSCCRARSCGRRRRLRRRA